MVNNKYLIVAFGICIAALVSAIDLSSDGVGEWHILTKLNFSSQIRLHPHILLIVTLPWSGEFRSLKKETSNLIRDRPDEFKSLNLMFMYKNVERMLSNAVGATENEVTVLYFHHSVSYKYRGRLRARNILYSIHPYMWGLSEELPFKTLTSEEDLKAFVDSTDRALILFEFCGWAHKLMAMGKRNGTENGFVGKGDLFGTSFQGESNRPLTFTEKNIHKGLADAKMKCDVTNVFGGVPWVADFSRVNDSAQFKETENVSSGISTSCAFEEHQKFDSFFSSFMSVARDFVLPPERLRTGLVSDRSMLKTLGIQDSDAWMVVLHFAGCPSCLKIVKNADELHNALQMDNSIIAELEGDSHSMESALPADKPSVLLFVDRSADSSDTRSKSKEALSAFRELALSNHIKYQMVGQNGDRLGKSVQDYEDFRGVSQHPKLKLSPKSKMIKLKNKMSTMMILNEDKHVTWNKQSSDLRSSLHDILESLLHEKKDGKLSSLAKELGFQLLSDDIDIQLVNTLPSESETQADHDMPKLLNEDHIASDVNIDKDKVELPYEQHLVNSKVTDAELHSKHYEEKIAHVDSNKQLKFAESELFADEDEIDVVGHVKAGETGYSDVDKLGEQQLHHFQVFTGSFFFSDGNYRLVQALTGELEVPAMVIIDPVVQRHYVFSAEKDFSYSSLTDFLTRFLNITLLPYQQSETALHAPREATRPPFVNLDFHEVDSIPQITSNTFSNLVLGNNQSDTDALNKDVLVLFSNRWCGFCQRMELVVCEVYRAMKGYINMLQSGYRSGKTMFDGGNLKDVILRLPLVYLLDCTLNDCSLILRSADQEEAYPALLLFPAERKNSIPITYEGHMAVTDVIKFIAKHGSHSQHLISENGILWSGAKKDRRNENISNAAQSVDMEKETPVAKELLHEVMLTNQAHKRVIKYDWLKSHTSTGSDEAAPLVVVGSILMATDKISAEPFAKSKILISKADRNNGFQGLIINKHMSWDAVGLEKGAEVLGESPLTFGGPLINNAMPLVALTRRIVNDKFPEVIPAGSGTSFLMKSLKELGMYLMPIRPTLIGHKVLTLAENANAVYVRRVRVYVVEEHWESGPWVHAVEEARGYFSCFNI